MANIIADNRAGTKFIFSINTTTDRNTGNTRGAFPLSLPVLFYQPEISLSPGVLGILDLHRYKSNWRICTEFAGIANTVRSAASIRTSLILTARFRSAAYRDFTGRARKRRNFYVTRFPLSTSSKDAEIYYSRVILAGGRENSALVS